MEQSEELAKPLEASGLPTFCFPVLAIAPVPPSPGPEKIIQQLDQYDGILLTSQNAVRYFFLHVKANVYPPFFCVGNKTAAALKAYGHAPTWTARQATALQLLQDLLQDNTAGKNYLFPCSEEARTELSNGLERAGAQVQRWPLYRPACAHTEPSQLLEKVERQQVALVVAASPSAVRFLFQQFGSVLFQNPEVKWAAIGPTTARSLVEHGINQPLVAVPPGVEGLVSVILDHFT